MQDDKIVIFDWGGVVVNLENNGLEHHNMIIKTLRRLGCNYNDEAILEKWFAHTSYGVNTHIDMVTDTSEVIAWWHLGEGKFQISADYDTFCKIYEEEFRKVPYYQDVVKYAHSLKNKTKIGVLSNLALFDKKIIEAHYRLENFDKAYLSFELGMRKPDKEIYQYVQNNLKIPPEKILFIDDLEKNTEVAKSCGWQTLKATGRELDKIKLAVEEFLFEI